jgi:hypothetical protein
MSLLGIVNRFKHKADIRESIIIKAEVKNLLADPDDLVQQWSTDIRKILKLPTSGQIKVSHELNSNFAEKAVAIDVDQYVLQGERGRGALNTLLVGTTNELREVLKPYRR